MTRQSIEIPVQARSTVIDNLRLARGRVESAEWFAVRPDADDAVMVRSLAQTAIYALQDVIDALPEESARELRRPADATLLLAERDV